MKKSFGLVLLFVAVFTVSLLLFGCSDNSVNPGDATVDNLNFKISVTSQGMLDVVSYFQVIITAIGRETMIVPLVYKQGVISGTIDNVPAGFAVTFLVQGLDAGGRVIYQGEDTVTIIPYMENSVNIQLTPYVSMIKFSPRYKQVIPGTPETLDIMAFNVIGLNQISFRIHSEKNMFYPDSMVLSPDLLELGNNLIFFDTLSYNPPFYAMAFANGSDLQTMADANGDVTLGTLHFTSPYPEALPDSEMVSIDSLTMYDVNGNFISSESVVRDQCFLLISELGDSIVTFPDPNLEQAIRNETGVSTRSLWLSDVKYMDILDADSMNITNLSGLEVCEGLEELYFGHNGIRDLTPLESLGNLTNLYLHGNQISDIQPLVNNENIDSGDYLILTGNPLNATSIETYIPILLQRGATVDY